MATVFIGLGSNQGEREITLERAVASLKACLNPRRLLTSSLYETSAILPELAPSGWNLPFLNQVIELELENHCDPYQVLKQVQAIEVQLGRTPQHEKWSPRPIDIDLLWWDQLTLDSAELKLPHPELLNRSFVLDPLSEIAPHLELTSGCTALQAARALSTHQPRFMGILNLTPDSFSDGGKWTDPDHMFGVIRDWQRRHIAMIDLGAESTRPGASAVTAQEEWTRLERPLRWLREMKQLSQLNLKVSVDTRSPYVAERALELGADLINDVSGFSNPELCAVVQNSNCGLVIMHSVSIPADPEQHLDTSVEPVGHLTQWFERRVNELTDQGLDFRRFILDPGIGFGKTSLQSYRILKNIRQLHALNFPLLVGHSRKSFMKNMTSQVPSDRDVETLGVTFGVLPQGIEIVRVHDPVLHQRALLAWSHLQ